ncbi:MAG: zinc ribbon domain-containing protein, partial [Thermoplasmata archaeon]
QRFIEYKAKDAGKDVVYVNPKHTSQNCSRCGYTDKNNRHGSVFKCNNCGSIKLHSWVDGEPSNKLQSFSED